MATSSNEAALRWLGKALRRDGETIEAFVHKQARAGMTHTAQRELANLAVRLRDQAFDMEELATAQLAKGERNGS